MEYFYIGMLALVVGAACVSHRHIPRFDLATLVAALFSAAPSLVIFDFVGGTRTDFVPFTLFALLLPSLAGSALVGIPFFLRRRRVHQPIVWVPVSKRISWAMLGGTVLVVCVRYSLFVKDADEALRMLLPWCLVGLLLGIGVNLLFNVGVAAAGWTGTMPRKHEFLIGLSTVALLLLLFAVTNRLVPVEWNQGVHKISFELKLNWLVLVAVIAGVLYGRRQRHFAADAAKWLIPMVTNPTNDNAVHTGETTRSILRKSNIMQALFVLALIVPALRSVALATSLIVSLLIYWSAVMFRRRQLGDIEQASELDILLMRWGFFCIFIVIINIHRLLPL